ncbi:MAG TPA: MotA/TolQ/ExbB proton channel family protein [Thermotogota bacterium]|nr:MotA/TolQ/ExbB proton channel family protein [Thermotogota bacterium]HRW93223.1 MotA/TolQ/ExbB proton channel family protein [Thermotogota bacterium]
MYLDLLKTGGPVLTVILVLAGIGLFFFFERLITLTTIRNRIREGEDSHPFLSQMQRKLGSLRGARIDEQGELIEQQIDRLFKNFRIISTVAVVSPLLGLLGTTTGMIKIFNTIEKTENLKYVNELAMGIGEALYTTIGGLIVGIVLTILLNILKERVSTIRHMALDRYTRFSTGGTIGTRA